jgi:hypothetical protein
MLMNGSLAAAMIIWNCSRSNRSRRSASTSAVMSCEMVDAPTITPAGSRTGAMLSET